jgi:SAM-dependent methyltransferase
MTYISDLASLKISTGILGNFETLNYLKEIIRLPNQASILDIGCQGGQLSIQLADLFEANVTGVDSEASAIDLAKKNIQQSTYQGKINFVHAEIVSTNKIQEKAYDLVIHRGLEAFIPDKIAFQKRLASLAKDWGYVVNITHTYEGEYDKTVIENLNKAGSMYIEPSSRSDLINCYKSVGLRLIGELYFDIEPSEVPDLGTSDDAKRVSDVLTIASENDKYTTGAVLIFRSQPSIFVSDACKG